MRAKNLKNQPIILQPERMGIGKSKSDNEEYEYVACSVWVIDRSGVVDSDKNVQITWWRVREQLRGFVGTDRYVAGRPVEAGDNSVILAPLEGAARKVAEQVIADFARGGQDTPPPADDPGEEPF